MKTLIILLLFTASLASARSTNYHCQVRQYNLDIDMTGDRSTGLFIIDRYNYNTEYVGYAGSIERGNRVTTFYFYGNEGPIKLSFLNKDIQDQPSKIKGHIDAMLGGFLIVDYFNCKER